MYIQCLVNQRLFWENEANKQNCLQLLINSTFHGPGYCFTLLLPQSKALGIVTASPIPGQHSKREAVFLKSPYFLRPLEDNLPEDV